MKDLYPKYFTKDFRSLAEALEVERRALAGDDRAQMRLADLYHRQENIGEREYERLKSNPDEAVYRQEGDNEGWVMGDDDGYEEDFWYRLIGGSAAKYFRELQQKSGIYARKLSAGLSVYGFQEPKASGSVGSSEHSYLRGENYFLYPRDGFPIEGAAFVQSQPRSHLRRAVASRDGNSPVGTVYYSLPKISHCEAEAKRGIADGAEQLAYTYRSAQAYYYEPALFKPYKEKTRVNPAYDPKRGEYWAGIARYLKGEGAEQERATFIREFWGVAGTPVEQYFAGFALIHGTLRDFAAGIAFLERSAGQGSAYAARELGEIYEGYDPGYAPAVFTHEPDAAARLEKAYEWYRKAGQLGLPNGKVRAEYLLSSRQTKTKVRPADLAERAPGEAAPTLEPPEGAGTNVASRPVEVFLCHSSGDKAAFRKLYHRLKEDGCSPWLDEEDLLPGQDREHSIRQAVRRSNAVLICLSRGSLTKEGFVQREIRFVLDVADEKPDGILYVIPVRLEECAVPERLRRWQWVDLFDSNGYARLLRALRSGSVAKGRDA